MFPGGRMDPRKLNAMMKQLGIQVTPIEEVQRIVITTPTKEYVFTTAEVTVMKAQGSTTYQIVGNPKIVEKGGAPATAGTEEAPSPAQGPRFAEEDVTLVMNQAKVPRERARKALQECDGEPAAAILKLLESS